MTQKIEHIGIVGGGKMGTSIFNFLCQYNFKIIWYIRKNADKAEKKYHRKLKRSLKNKLISADEFDYMIHNHVIVDSVTKLTDADLIIECINENLLAKQSLISELFSIIRSDALVASNSSSFKPEILADEHNRARVVGLHFFYPVEIKHITELVLSNYNSEKDIQKIEEFLKSINKFYLIQNNESAFLLNRMMLKLQAAAYNYAVENKCTFEQIDAAAKQYLFPMGIFETMDHVGIDIIYQSAQNYIEDEEDKSIFLPLLNFMEQCIKENKLGIKTQQGFYNYTNTISVLETNDNNKKIAEFLIHSYQSAYNWALSITNNNAADIDFCMNEYLDMDMKKCSNAL